MIAWFARNHVAANLLMIAILMLGLMSLSKLPLEVFPRVEPSSVSVAIALPGSTPEEVEEGVTIKVEEAVQDLEGIERITSSSRENSSSVRIEVDNDFDARTVLAEIKNQVDAINTFPAGVENPVISLARWTPEVITVVLSGPYSELEIRQQAERVRDDLLRLDGVTQVRLDGVRQYEIAINISEATLNQYGLTLQSVAEAIRASSIDISAGALQTEGGEVLVRSVGQAYQQDDFENIVILTQPDGSIIRLRDLALVNDGFVTAAQNSRFNGQPAAFIDVFRTGDQSAITVADKVKQYITELAPGLPQDMEVTYWRDRSKIVKKRLQTLTNSAIQGGFLVLLLLTLFLRPAIAFWVFIGIPISFMGAFLFMPLFGITLNIVSLFAFIVVLGIVVDDAIVTGENIYTHLRRSEDGLQAVITGTHEVAVPVTFGILTTMAAFLPIAFIAGARGQIFGQITAVVIPILAFSLIESKLILPSHLKHLRIGNLQRQQSSLEKWQTRFADGFEAAIVKYYQPLLRQALHYRYLFLAIIFGLLMLLYALLSSGWLNFVFFPRVQSEVASANLAMPVGTPFSVTDRYITLINNAALGLKERYNTEGEQVILDIQAITGTSGEHAGRVMFEIESPEDRVTEVTSSELVAEWRGMIGEIPGADSLTFRAEIGRVRDPLDIQFSGGDFGELESVAEQVKMKLSQYPSLFDIEDSFSSGKEELQIELLPTAYVLGLNRTEIISQVRQALYGFEVQRIQRGRDDVRVMVRYPEADRQSVSQLQDMIIVTDNGDRIPLGQLASLAAGISPVAIDRIDRYRTINVRADLDKASTNMLLLRAEMSTYIDDLLLQYPGVSYSWEGEAKEQSQSFGSLKIGLIFVLFAIYCLLAIPFKSYSQPAIVMTVIPFSTIGAVAGHWVMGIDLTLVSLLGMLALVGVVVNDSLVLVDFINQHRQRAESLKLAILNAGVKRFRPVILTSLTTFLGLTPLLLEKTTQAQFLIPMAVSLGFGIVFATVLTLLLVPVNYLVVEDMKTLFSGRQSTENTAGT